MIECLTEMLSAQVGLPAAVVSGNNWCVNSVITQNA